VNIAPSNRFDHLTQIERQAATEFVDKVYHHFGDQVTSILLFGSRARGDADEDSDMDLLVVLTDTEPGIVRAIRDLAADVWLKYGIYLSTRVWSQDHWRTIADLQTQFYLNVRKDGVSLT
jgi:predicted nucleotidyltransferase